MSRKQVSCVSRFLIIRVMAKSFASGNTLTLNFYLFASKLFQTHEVLLMFLHMDVKKII